MIHLVVALAPEARPLIEHLKLKVVSTSPGYRIYEGDGVRLVQSGIGKVASGGACAWLAGWAQRTEEDPDPCFWLNAGIAGRKESELGEAFLAHKIVDSATQRSFYPSFPFEIPLPSYELLSVDSPSENLPDRFAVDMEAFGFFSVASRFQTAECIHSLKVVSDNAESSADQLTPQRIEELVQQNLNAIDGCIEIGREVITYLNQRIEANPLYHSLIEKAHFTVSEKRRLKTLTRHLLVLSPEFQFQGEDLKSKKIIASLEESLASVAAPDYAQLDSKVG